MTQRWPIELVQKHPWLGKPINTENQPSSLSYVTTTNRAQEQGGVHQMQKRQGQPIYA